MHRPLSMLWLAACTAGANDPDAEAPACLAAEDVCIDAGCCPPDFELPNARGGTTRLSDQYGDVVLVDLVALWCDSCFDLAPGLEGLHRSYSGDGFQVVTFLTEGVSGNPTVADAQQWAADFGVTSTVVADTDGTAHPAWDRGGQTMIPMTYILDRDGAIAWYAGGSGTLEEMERQLQTMLP